MKALLALVSAACLLGCSQTSPDPVCQVLNDPSAYVGRAMTLNGTARMYQQRIGLGSNACPSAALVLTMSADDILKSKRGESVPTAPFFNQVIQLLGTGASVTVTGRVAPAPNRTNAYEFVVESGSLR